MPGEVVRAGGRRRHRPAGRRGWRLTRRGRMVVGALGVLPHGPVLRQAGAYGARAGQPYDFRPMLADLRPVVAGADLAVCHLEVPLSRDGRDIASWPSFNAPPQLASALRWAGYDACSTASNHAVDRGAAGVAGHLSSDVPPRVECVWPLAGPLPDWES